jgi:hypothetical protein
VLDLLTLGVIDMLLNFGQIVLVRFFVLKSDLFASSVTKRYKKSFSVTLHYQALLKSP